MNFFSATVPVGPPHTYLTLSLRSLGFNTIQSNLLSVPAYVIGAIGLLSTCYLSEMINSRVLSTVILQFWALPLLIVLYTFTEHTSQWVYFAVVSLIVGFPYVHPIQVAWTSRNSNGVSTRTISACMYNISLQAGYIISVSEHTFADR
jgi:predicted MFS family arabinose efflux permease